MCVISWLRMQLKVIFLEGNKAGNTLLAEAHSPQSDTVQPLKLPPFQPHLQEHALCDGWILHANGEVCG